MFYIKVVEDKKEKSAICRLVLEALPDWFGIPEATENYIKNAENELMVVAYNGATDEVMGFATALVHNKKTAEIAVMGVMPNQHRTGIGRKLLAYLENELSLLDIDFLTVKTLAASHPSPEYARTRIFYENYGFTELEVLVDLWGSDNPCSFMLKCL